jgi:hypothetical protein
MGYFHDPELVLQRNDSSADSPELAPSNCVESCLGICNLRNSQSWSHRQTPIDAYIKGPISVLAGKPPISFTYDFAVQSAQCPINVLTLFEQFC